MSRTKKAYKNLEFLNSSEARAIRILCEYEEPKRRFAAQNVDDNNPEFNIYSLVVTDPYGNTNSDNVTVQIENINVAPEIVNISDDLNL